MVVEQQRNATIGTTQQQQHMNSIKQIRALEERERSKFSWIRGEVKETKNTNDEWEEDRGRGAEFFSGSGWAPEWEWCDCSCGAGDGF